jgi:hypothetical protein
MAIRRIHRLLRLLVIAAALTIWIGGACWPRTLSKPYRDDLHWGTPYVWGLTQEENFGGELERTFLGVGARGFRPSLLIQDLLIWGAPTLGLAAVLLHWLRRGVALPP